MTIAIAQPLVGQEEIDAVVAVLQSGNLVQGELVDRFERRFSSLVGAAQTVAVANGTAALHLALLAHGIGPGDEVITTPFSFIATANAILFAGARPVFVDICADTYAIDPEQIERRITTRTRAILPVHLYGHPANMSEITAIAERHGLQVIEDAAQAHGAAIADRPIGAVGTACFSFYATKNVITGEGGAITTNDEQLATRLRMLRSHGQRERYHHEILGYNFRLTDLQAAIGLVQLGRLDELTVRRIANAAYLTDTIRQVATPVVQPGYRHVYHQYTIRIPHSRAEAVAHLHAAGIGCGIHYPVPIHQQPVYTELGYEDCLPVAEQASREVLSVPVHPSLSQADLAAIAIAVNTLPARCLDGRATEPAAMATVGSTGR